MKNPENQEVDKTLHVAVLPTCGLNMPSQEAIISYNCSTSKRNAFSYSIFIERRRKHGKVIIDTSNVSS